MRDLDEIRVTAQDKSPLGADRTKEILDTNFRRIPLRTQYALAQFPLGSASVLDVGCAYGTSLAHFGNGSIGLDNNPEAVAFCKALGLEAQDVDVDDDFDLGGREFDYIWVSDILEHLEAPRLLLRRLIPALAPTGKLLLQTSVLPSRLARRVLRSRGKQPFDADVHYHQWTQETMTHLLSRAGYHVPRVLVPRPPELSAVSLFLRPAFAPRLIFVASPDEATLRTVERSENRNRRLA
ncbi:MAG: class I SAM-dependent methyltransferase [Actinobacteria bacterium]|nr:class I SAM-dependent methyltransferase [Actinomycetota bacterium]